METRLRRLILSYYWPNSRYEKTRLERLKLMIVRRRDSQEPTIPILEATRSGFFSSRNAMKLAEKEMNAETVRRWFLFFAFFWFGCEDEKRKHGCPFFESKYCSVRDNNIMFVLFDTASGHEVPHFFVCCCIRFLVAARFAAMLGFGLLINLTSAKRSGWLGQCGLLSFRYLYAFSSLGWYLFSVSTSSARNESTTILSFRVFSRTRTCSVEIIIIKSICLSALGRYSMYQLTILQKARQAAGTLAHWLHRYVPSRYSTCMEWYLSTRYSSVPGTSSVRNESTTFLSFHVYSQRERVPSRFRTVPVCSFCPRKRSTESNRSKTEMEWPIHYFVPYHIPYRTGTRYRTCTCMQLLSWQDQPNQIEETRPAESKTFCAIPYQNK